ncbi:tRNA glutamyl-Q(34) synthetase GluQRS [Croceicoccus naphthovorans]|uniref:Glutamyl-tRNA synthetase n=1 Tax=Croceicoccus naphthovorans TaxID=1348774 RepID=A0A0G3XEE6_9SPHN|nr:tRNA glutamyl-Q(34) synthetase GluQRS [Croceicoccus naphthovorans]AKM08989.1 glutamyl-tRNA synthetase [Croceicoccus naphthovorans]MBB3989199.1 glutamyl-Q tRNA(Asp) synthetase [Croceicoccus naphthovorans]
MTTVTRFAPSPNGPLHLGHAYAAVVAHDLARAREGRFLLRIEDIDGARSRAEFAESTLDDLRWLGLDWDGAAIRQSARIAAHAAALDDLRREGLVYPCTCTRAEVAAAATETGPDGPIYPGTCRGRTDGPDGPDGPVAWRLDMARAIARAGPLKWTDELAGVQVAQPELFGDVVLGRKDAPGSYHLAVTLDDAADGVTLVTRGMDLFASTHVHRLLQTLLGLSVPVWHHHALLVEGDGEKLAKRRGSPSLADRRLAGEDGRALAADIRAGRFPGGLSLSFSALAIGRENP